MAFSSSEMQRPGCITRANSIPAYFEAAGSGATFSRQVPGTQGQRNESGVQMAFQEAHALQEMW